MIRFERTHINSIFSLPVIIKLGFAELQTRTDLSRWINCHKLIQKSPTLWCKKRIFWRFYLKMTRNIF